MARLSRLLTFLLVLAALLYTIGAPHIGTG
jgi:hypothetical protein